MAVSHGARSSVWRNHFNSHWIKERDPLPVYSAKKNRKQKIEYDNALYKQRHKVENMLGKTV